MKKILFVMVLVTFAAGTAAAYEEIPAFEIFVGYSPMKLGMSNDDIRHFQEGFAWDGAWNNGEASFFLGRGGAISVASNLNEYFSIAVDAKYNQGDLAEGYYQFESPETETLVNTPFVTGAKTASALVGPRVSFRKERGTAFFHALAGLDYWRWSSDFMYAGEKWLTASNHFGPGIAIGGGLDLNLNEKIAVRVIQADYYLARRMEQWTNNLNLSFGIVFRFGEKVLW